MFIPDCLQSGAAWSTLDVGALGDWGNDMRIVCGRNGEVVRTSGRRIRLALLVAVLLLPTVAVGPVGAEDAAEPEVPVAPQIINGSNVPGPNPYPWMVALLFTGWTDPYEAQFCAGMLVAPTWVLTAAHCVDEGRIPSEVQVAVNVLNLSSIASSARRQVRSITLHPSWDENGDNGHDLALLELTGAVTGVAPVALIQPGRALAVGTGARAIGWGRDVAGEYPDRLQWAAVEVAASDTATRCADWSTNLYTGSLMLCAAGDGVRNTAGVCNGDSGGPLAVWGTRGWELAGITSFGSPGCMTTGAPGVFTRVSAFTPWICQRIERFVDVPFDVYYDAPAHELWRRGVTTGTSASCEYAPTQLVTRSQMALFLWRLANKPATSTSCGLRDVPASAGYAGAACWLLGQQITTNNPYNPGGIVTRGQMAAFLWRLAGRPAAATSCGFDDEAAIRPDFRQATCWLKAKGITTSNPYKPGDPVSRAQMAAFLVRTSTQLTSPPPTTTTTPPTSTTVPAPRSVLGSGQMLNAGEQLKSSDRRFTLWMQLDGNLVLYGPAGALWASGTGRAGSVAIMQGDGNLVVVAPGNVPVWSSGSAGNPGAYLALQSDGNLVIYSTSNRAVWATMTIVG